MIKRVLKIIERLNAEKSKFVTEQSKLQKKIDDIDIKIKNYTTIKKEYEKLEKKFIDCTHPKEEKNNKKVELTKNEFKIIYYLTLNKNKIVPREDIINYLWESESFIDDNTLTVNMKRLRDKLEELGLEDLIETKRGLGYILK